MLVLVAAPAVAEEAGRGSTGSFEVSPSRLFVRAHERAFTSLDVTLRNKAETPVTWSVVVSPDWLILPVRRGVLESGSSVTLGLVVKPDVAAVRSDALVFESQGAGTRYHMVTVTSRVQPAAAQDYLVPYTFLSKEEAQTSLLGDRWMLAFQHDTDDVSSFGDFIEYKVVLERRLHLWRGIDLTASTSAGLYRWRNREEMVSERLEGVAGLAAIGLRKQWQMRDVAVTLGPFIAVKTGAFFPITTEGARYDWPNDVFFDHEDSPMLRVNEAELGFRLGGLSVSVLARDGPDLLELVSQEMLDAGTTIPKRWILARVAYGIEW